MVSLIILARVFRMLGPTEFMEVKWPAPWALAVIGAIGGVLVGMTSIGGGTVIMALSLIFFSIPLNKMVGIDVVHGALLAGLTTLNYALQVKQTGGLWGCFYSAHYLVYGWGQKW